jgi:16S rRNA C967 or C1407 C5-methylase (RsmB/RsmF family)
VIILSSKTNTSASVDYTKTLNALLRNHRNSQKQKSKVEKKKPLLTAWINLNKEDETSKCETLKFNANNLKHCPTSVKLDDLKYQPKNQMKLDDGPSPTKTRR